jgi:D-beta-D-heptose 7-phosphate kinase/D-beta-D-heptose 1-phosphate adenosyltransferase
VLAALEMVDAVVLFDEDTPRDLIAALEPDVLAKGADYALEDIVGADLVTARGGRVVRVPLVEGVSTTSLLAKVRHGSS